MLLFIKTSWSWYSPNGQNPSCINLTYLRLNKNTKYCKQSLLTPSNPGSWVIQPLLQLQVNTIPDPSLQTASFNICERIGHCKAYSQSECDIFSLLNTHQSAVIGVQKWPWCGKSCNQREGIADAEVHSFCRDSHHRPPNIMWPKD